MTPKQAAAKLLLHALDKGQAIGGMSREDMATVLSERVSEVKHARIIEFAGKISAPFRERLERIVGAGETGETGEAGEADGEAPAASTSH